MAITKQKRITVYKTAINNQHVHKKKKQRSSNNWSISTMKCSINTWTTSCHPSFRPRGAAASLSICENASAFGVSLRVTGIQLFFNNGLPKQQQGQHSLNLETIWKQLKKKLPPWDTERAGPRLPHWGLMLSRKTLVFWFSFKLMSAYTNYHESHVPSKIFFSWTE